MTLVLSNVIFNYCYELSELTISGYSTKRKTKITLLFFGTTKRKTKIALLLSAVLKLKIAILTHTEKFVVIHGIQMLIQNVMYCTFATCKLCSMDVIFVAYFILTLCVP